MLSVPALALLLAMAVPLRAQDAADERALWKRLAARCGEDLRWAKDWDEAAARARDERKPVLAIAWLYPGFDVIDGSRLFAMDPDIIELVNERCVPLQLAKDTQVPFAAQASYGLSATAFGCGLLLASADGEVLADFASLDVTAAHEFLCTALGAHPELAGAEVERSLTSEVRAARHLARGELAAAEKALGQPRSARGSFLRARLLRRRHDLAGALAALEEARRREPEEELAAAIEFERIAVLVGLGRGVEIPSLCARIEREYPAREEARGATYLLGLLDLARDDRTAATRRWRALIDEHPGSQWSAVAAAMLLAPGAELAGFQLAAPAADVLASVREVAREPLPAKETKAAAPGALEWLLANRRADGTWPDSSEIGAPPSNAISAAIDVLAVRALLARHPKVDVEREARLVLAATRASLAVRSDEPTYMTYEVWSDALTLELLADLLESRSKSVPAAELRALGGDLVGELAKRQRTNGGWSYFEAVSLEPGAQKIEQSISFVTASVVLAFLRAHDAGIEVDEDALACGVDCLEVMRSDEGVFDYMLYTREARLPRDEIAGAAGRGPLCELALLRAGRSDPGRLAAALELFFLHAGTLEKELGKALMHCGPEGQGCHYVLYDYAAAARAIAALPEDRRKPFATRLAERLLAARRADGSFLDTQVLGPVSGTSLALLAFAALDADR